MRWKMRGDLLHIDESGVFGGVWLHIVAIPGIQGNFQNPEKPRGERD